MVICIVKIGVGLVVVAKVLSHFHGYFSSFCLLPYTREGGFVSALAAGDNDELWCEDTQGLDTMDRT